MQNSTIDKENHKYSMKNDGVIQRDLSTSRVNYGHNFTVNLPAGNLKGASESLMLLSKATNLSTNISQDERTQRLPRIVGKGKISHLRINSFGADESGFGKIKQSDTSYNSSPFRSSRHTKNFNITL